MGFQIDTDGTAYLTGKVHALDGLEVRHEKIKMFAAVEATGARYFRMCSLIMLILMISIKKRPWISIRVDYSTFT